MLYDEQHIDYVSALLSAKTDKSTYMSTNVEIGIRLKLERERLGFSQGDFAEVGGIQRTTLFNYEKGIRSPDAAFLSCIADKGADVLYVVTGTHAVSTLTPQQDMALAVWFALPIDMREWILAAAAALSTCSEKGNLSP